MTQHETPVLGLPFIQEAQAQKHVTHNEALRVLDALVQVVVEEGPRADPPGDPRRGARFVVGAGATGDWAGRDGALTWWDGVAWLFATPAAGWQANTADGGYRYDGATWRPFDLRPTVGPVAMAGERPSGAIMERGGNENGEYIRFADGTQICTGEERTPSGAYPRGALFFTAHAHWTYPAPFTAPPTITGTTGHAHRWVTFEYPLTDRARARVMMPTEDDGTQPVKFFAIGRWN